VGLPLIWLMTGAWLKLILFLALLAVAVLAVARDHEEEPIPPQPGPDDEGDAGPGSAPGDLPVRPAGSGWQVAAATPPPLLRQARQALAGPGVQRLLMRL